MSKLDKAEDYSTILIILVFIWFIVSMCSCGYKKECYHGCPSDPEDPQKTVLVTGPAGEAGTSCHITRTDDASSAIQCGDDTPVYVHDGQSGRNGSDGRSGLDGTDGRDAQGITIFTPCPETASIVAYPERMLHFSDGSILAFLSDPNYMYQRLVTLIPGATYQTTDGRNCVFTAE